MGISNPKKRKREERSRKSAKKIMDERVTCKPAAEEPVPVQDQWNTLRNILTELDTFEDYREEGYLFYKALEEEFSRSVSLTKQNSINESLWREVTTLLIKVHRHFSLDFSTLCLAINYLARYISGRNLRPGIMKPAGATCLYLAIKMMEENPPKEEEFLELYSETHYSPKFLAFMENIILYRLECRLHQPTINFFLEHFTLLRVAKEMCSDSNITRAANVLTAARGIAALTMVKYEFQNYLPSLLAQCCLKAAEHILGYNSAGELPSECISQSMQKYFRKIFLLASANKDFLYQLMPGVFPEVFPKLTSPPTIQRVRTEATEPAKQQKKPSLQWPKKESGAKEPDGEARKTSAKRPKKETGPNTSVKHPKGNSETTAAEAVEPRRTARNTQRCCRFCNGTYTYQHSHTDSHLHT